MSDEFDGRDSHCLCRADIWQLERQVESLKDEISKYRGMELEISALKLENERLNELRKFTTPLNHNQIESLADDWCLPSSEISRIDEAFRKIREGAL